MLHIRVTLSCDGCEKVFGEDHFGSVMEAGKAAECTGWKTIGIYNRWFHFCPACQTADQAVKAAA